MQDTATIYWGLLFGSIGFGFFLYGKRQKRVVPFICGILLILLPYFVSDTVFMALTGIALGAAPFLIRQ